MMKPHKVGAAIRKADVCYAWVWLTDDDGIFIQVSKTEARQFVDEAKEVGLTEILAYVKGKELFLGDDEESAEGSESSEEDAGEEEEDLGLEEEEEEEEEETEEEEEAPAAKVAEAKKRK
jgi:dihydrofolate reductase